MASGLTYDFNSPLFIGERVIMHNIGLDVGTKNIVVAYDDGEKVNHLRETNGYFVYPRSTKFIENMLNNQAIVRSDGTKRAAKWVKLPNDSICVLGADAEELAYAQNATMSRPMAEGSVTSDEESMTILASIVQGLLEMAENEFGKFDKQVNICYCTTAPAVNKEISMDYHRKVVDMIISGYETKAKISTSSITEAHAIVLNESADGTGIGISWGAGTVTVSYVKYGMEIYSFCWVGAGDWIDEQVAARHGFADKTKKAKETPTTIAKRKHSIDLSIDPVDRIDTDIRLHYEILIANVINGVVSGFTANESNARIDTAINVYMAGGTASPKGFEKLVKEAFTKLDMPFEIGKIVTAGQPLFAVADGCLKAAVLNS